jgi:hypothetical protein
VEWRPVPKPSQKDMYKHLSKKEPAPVAKLGRKMKTVAKRSTPKKGQRSQITGKEYKQAVEAHGEMCLICGNPSIEMHHVMFASRSGRGVWRNLAPLCKKHHTGTGGVHGKNGAKLAKQLQTKHVSVYGKYYYQDRHDLFKSGLIPDTKLSSFEEFMIKQQQSLYTDKPLKINEKRKTK